MMYPWSIGLGGKAIAPKDLLLALLASSESDRSINTGSKTSTVQDRNENGSAMSTQADADAHIATPTEPQTPPAVQGHGVSRTDKSAGDGSEPVLAEDENKLEHEPQSSPNKRERLEVDSGDPAPASPPQDDSRTKLDQNSSDPILVLKESGRPGPENENGNESWRAHDAPIQPASAIERATVAENDNVPSLSSYGTGRITQTPSATASAVAVAEGNDSHESELPSRPLKKTRLTEQVAQSPSTAPLVVAQNIAKTDQMACSLAPTAADPGSLRPYKRMRISTSAAPSLYSLETPSPRAELGHSESSVLPDLPRVRTPRPSTSSSISTSTSTSTTPLHIRIPARRPSQALPSGNKINSKLHVPVDSGRDANHPSLPGSSSSAPIAVPGVCETSTQEYPCAKPGSSRMCMRRNGLRYHQLAGPRTADVQDTRRMDSPHRIGPRYSCPTKECCKTFKQRNGLKYHTLIGRCVTSNGIKIKKPEIQLCSVAPGYSAPENLDGSEDSGFVDEPIAAIDGCPVHQFLNFEKFAASLNDALHAAGLPRQPVSKIPSASPLPDTGNVGKYDSTAGRSEEYPRSAPVLGPYVPLSAKNMRSLPDLRFSGEFSLVCDPGILRSDDSRENELSRMAEAVTRGLSDMLFARLTAQRLTKDRNHAHVVCTFDCTSRTAPADANAVPQKGPAEMQRGGLKPGIPAGKSMALSTSYLPSIYYLPCAVLGCPFRSSPLSEETRTSVPTKTASNPDEKLVLTPERAPPGHAVPFNTDHIPASSYPMSWNIRQLVELDLGMGLSAIIPSNRRPPPNAQMDMKNHLPTAPSPVSQYSAVRRATNLTHLSDSHSPSHSCMGVVQVRVTFDHLHPVSGVVGIKTVILFEHNGSEPPEHFSVPPTPAVPFLPQCPQDSQRHQREYAAVMPLPLASLSAMDFSGNKFPAFFSPAHWK